MAGPHHPNICPFHETGEAEEKTFFSMVVELFVPIPDCTILGRAGFGEVLGDVAAGAGGTDHRRRRLSPVVPMISNDRLQGEAFRVLTLVLCGTKVTARM